MMAGLRGEAEGVQDVAASPRVALGLETSCDETAAALVSLGENASGPGRILGDSTRAQFERHAPYGGVVPEIAARAHAEALGPAIDAAFAEAGLARGEVDVVAATTGPGLLAGLTVGALAGQGAALALQRPFVAVNHLEAHALTVRLTQGLSFPYLLLLVSGGHCQLLSVQGVGRYKRLGTTLDDALGEAFDKTAKLMGLGYPGGPAIETLAREGRPDRFALPRPMVGRPGADMSFAGLKTAVRHGLADLSRLGRQDQADMAASFQAAAGDVVTARTARAMDLHLQATGGEGRALVAAGGVAANADLRTRLDGLCQEEGWCFHAPPLALCTDNAAMVAWTGLERARLGLTDALGVTMRPRWPLDPDEAPAPTSKGWGRKGAKA
jgi:N6-L-threonylcarbamoyladenine synthase